MATNEVMMWAIEHFHPRSSSIRHVSRTRADALQESRDSYVRAYAGGPTPDRGGEVWDSNYAAGLFRPVRVTVSWEPK